MKEKKHSNVLFSKSKVYKRLCPICGIVYYTNCKYQVYCDEICRKISEYTYKNRIRKAFQVSIEKNQ